jgi:hypothetical protein
MEVVLIIEKLLQPIFKSVRAKTRVISPPAPAGRRGPGFRKCRRVATAVSVKDGAPS